MGPMQKNGFTLVEMAIVLMVVGLLLAGILVGQSLLRQAHISRAIKEYNEILAGHNNFIGKYGCMAGDCALASRVFDNAECFRLGADEGIGFCNGNGNGQIEQWQESHLYWIHLHLANIISLRDGDWAAHRVSSFDSKAYYLATSANFGYGMPTYTFYFIFNLGASSNYDAALDPDFAYRMDTKLDDGAPLSGVMVALQGHSSPGNCITSIDQYNTSNKTAACVAAMKIE
jgi:prepilin-type N-terminal cleavage/methylation domain-containing protein